MTIGGKMTQPVSSWEDAVRWLRDQPAQSDLVRDAYYDDPLEAAAERYWRSNEWQAIRKLVGQGPGVALDAGAGRGIASYALAREGFRVSALEPDESDFVGAGAIRSLAGASGLPIEVVGEISERLPFEDGTFDVIFARAVLHHISDLPAAMKEFFRVLKPGGVFLAIREHVISREDDRADFLRRHPLHHRYGGENAFRVEIYEAAIRTAGFRIERVFKPFDSAINFGPRSLKEQFASVIPVPLIPGIAAMALQAPGLGAIASAALAWIDHRPGRHYSFLASRPAQ
jgi:SAM-dependent methyltransferase